MLIIQAQHRHTGKLPQVKLRSWQLWYKWGRTALIFEAHRLHPRNSLAQSNLKTAKRKEMKRYFELQDVSCLLFHEIAKSTILLKVSPSSHALASTLSLSACRILTMHAFQHYVYLYRCCTLQVGPGLCLCASILNKHSRIYIIWRLWCYWKHLSFIIMGFYPCVDLYIYNSKHARNSGAQIVVNCQCRGHSESYECVKL